MRVPELRIGLNPDGEIPDLSCRSCLRVVKAAFLISFLQGEKCDLKVRRSASAVVLGSNRFGETKRKRTKQGILVDRADDALGRVFGRKSYLPAFR